MGYRDVDDKFVETENRSRLCYAMIETPGALRDIKSIAALPTVDGLFAGPSDLSLSTGRGMFKGEGSDFSALRCISEAAQARSKSFAVAAPNSSYRREAQHLGASFIGITDEVSAMRAGFTAMIKI
jgi:2-keto-3-deoxy-L-rhamnonate aldolase RhmA